MEGRGGCCIARFAEDPYEKSKVDRIMLRYRPIAPKPVVGGVVTGNSSPENKERVFRVERVKRRYVRDDHRRCIRRRRVFLEEKLGGFDESVEDDTTVMRLLPLLPEIPDRKDITERNTPVDLAPIWLKFSGKESTVLRPQPLRPVGSFVTVGRVTEEAYVDGEVLGSTDEERKKNLERDTCPGFISDGLNKVEWTNEAYKKMIGEGESRPEMECLLTEEKLPLSCPAFACPVRLQYTRSKEKHSMTIPCDVWRMDGGRFAWRLDVKAALSLGR
ncbi:uncharacterized protein LOC122081479 [Macadamia integrifolia]|uniref:uncharacterized protein LOC122081479 n=1 Tax=Macadamia integrifolia TaxID=60698 RepID=UPI001C4FFC49|nr:uncharacterized protein LOC122081479 [Macadamia integrifolia]